MILYPIYSSKLYYYLIKNYVSKKVLKVYDQNYKNSGY